MAPHRHTNTRPTALLALLPAALLTTLALAGCTADQPLTGEVIEKNHHPGCTVRQIMGTASGPLAYDETIDEAWTLTIRHHPADPKEDNNRETVTFHVDADTWKQTRIGDTHTEQDPYWFHDQCADPFTDIQAD